MEYILMAEVEWCPVEVRKPIGPPESFTLLIYCLFLLSRELFH
jgi:hypothetical protein